VIFDFSAAAGRLVDVVRRARRDRGATAVEYALVISVFVLGAVGGIDVLEDSTRDEYLNSADGIEGLPGNEGFGGGGTATSAPPTLPTTTTTVIDSSPTTTSGGSGTTTTLGGDGTTTTTVARFGGITAVNDLSTRQAGRWTARADIQIRDSIDLSPIPNAVLTVKMSAANGSSFTTSCTTGQDGRCVASWPSRWNKHDPVLATVTDVVSSPEWDGLVLAGQLHKP
jgi:Flp pilus assembly pilin Flp